MNKFDPVVITPASDGTKGGIDVSIRCDKCGEPIVSSDKFGMHCKNKCNLAESKKAFGDISRMLKGMMGECEEMYPWHKKGQK